MSRPSATRPGGLREAPLAVHAAPFAPRGMAATREAAIPGGLGAQDVGDVTPFQQHPLAAIRPAPKFTSIARRARAWAIASCGSSLTRSAARARRADTARRCRAGASRAHGPPHRLMVPLPEPLGPSIVMIRDGRLHDSLAREPGRTLRPASTKPGNEVATFATSTYLDRSARRAGSPPRMPWRCDDRRGCRRGRRDSVPPSMRMPSGSSSMRDSEARAGPCAITARRSLSFTRSSARTGHPRLARRAGGGDEEHRKLVDRERHQLGRHVDAAQSAARTSMIRHGLRSAATRELTTRMSAPMRRRMSSTPVRVGLMPTLRMTKSPAPRDSPATRKKAADEKSPGTLDVARAQVGLARHARGASRARHTSRRSSRACARCGREWSQVPSRTVTPCAYRPRAAPPTSPARSPRAWRSGCRAECATAADLAPAARPSWVSICAAHGHAAAPRRAPSAGA